jgi:hypothetical protein
MDTHPAAPAALGLVSFAFVGFVFGAVVRLIGKIGGGIVGRWVVDALGPLHEELMAVIAGGVDGALFLGVVGLLVGVFGNLRVVAYALVGLVALCAGALVFGGLAHVLSGRRSRVVSVLCGLVAGAAVGATVTDGQVYGGVGGALLGSVMSGLAGGRTRPQEPDHVPPEDTADPR